MAKLGGSRYDPDMQQYVDAPRNPRLESLKFLRWLGERGMLEHLICGPSKGEYAVLSAGDNRTESGVGARKPEGGKQGRGPEYSGRG